MQDQHVVECGQQSGIQQRIILGARYLSDDNLSVRGGAGKIFGGTRPPTRETPARPQGELGGFYIEETAVKTAFFGKKRFRSTAHRNGRYPAQNNFFPLYQKRLGTWLWLNERRARACLFSDKPNEDALK